MSKTTWIRPVYFYLMTTIGLVVLIIGLVQILNLGLKVFIFTQADMDFYGNSMPSPLYMEKDGSQVQELVTCENLSAEDQDRIQAWLTDYETWQNEDKNVDYLRSNRERQAANAIAMILVGFPLYYFHWFLIKRDRKKDLV